MDTFIALTKALSDASRVRALLALGRGEVCVCRLIELLRLAPSTVSKHMALLKQAGLVASRKEGRWIYFRLADEKKDRAAARFIELAQDLIGSDGTVQTDRARMAGILKQDAGKLCKLQKER